MNDSIGNEKTRIFSDKEKGYGLSVGDRLGQYRVVRLLGRGGMGEVYEVEHEVLGGRFAMKLLPSSLEWRMSLERFKNEARVMFQLNHPNIVKVDDFGETDGRYWLRMELVAAEPPDMEDGSWDMGGVTLQDYAEARGGRIPHEELAGILAQICEGLAYAHGKGAIHRDLKPANVLLEVQGSGFKVQGSNEVQGSGFKVHGSRDAETLNGGEGGTLNFEPIVKISDFGLVRLVGEEWVKSRVEESVRQSMSMGEQPTRVGEGSAGSSTRSMVGTFEFMSPEQKRGEEVDARSDVYSLGLMAFKLLTGENPGLKPPSRLVEGLPLFWDDLLISALEEKRENRMESVEAFLKVLRTNTEVLPTNTPQPPKPDTAPPPPPPSPPKPSTGSVGSKPKPAPNPLHHDDPERPPGTEAEFEIYPGVMMKFCWCPATTSEAWKQISGGKDTFTMGSPEDEEGRGVDEAQHEVRLTRGFWMGKYTVTQGQWEKVMGSNPSGFRTGVMFWKKTKQTHPVESVSWANCQKFMKMLKKEGEEDFYRLPSEAEWEYACRAGTSGPFSGDLGRMAWYHENSGNKTHEVGKKQANTWGLHDMHGNVCEWSEDWYGTYSTEMALDPVGAVSGSNRVHRGGSWAACVGVCRSAYRGGGKPGYRWNDLGLRLVRSVHPCLDTPSTGGADVRNC